MAARPQHLLSAGASRIILAATADPFVTRFRRGGLDPTFGDRGTTRIRYGLIGEPPIAVSDGYGRVMLTGEGMIEGHSSRSSSG